MKKINSKLFKESMSKFATGITVITINIKNIYIGKTINSFSALSLNPPLVLYALDNQSSSLKEYKQSLNIGINILSKKQIDISKYFSNKKPEWKYKNYFLTKNKIPMINDCVANFVCKKKKIFKQGDHTIFICEIKEIMIDNSKKPLIYFNSKYI